MIVPPWCPDRDGRRRWLPRNSKAPPQPPRGGRRSQRYRQHVGQPNGSAGCHAGSWVNGKTDFWVNGKTDFSAKRKNGFLSKRKTDFWVNGKTDFRAKQKNGFLERRDKKGFLRDVTKRIFVSVFRDFWKKQISV